MKRPAIWLLVFGCLGPCAAFGNQQTSMSSETPPKGSVEAMVATPRAIIEGAHYQFGPVLEGTLFKHTFVVKNSGSASLKIEKVQTS